MDTSSSPPARGNGDRRAGGVCRASSRFGTSPTRPRSASVLDRTQGRHYRRWIRRTRDRRDRGQPAGPRSGRSRAQWPGGLADVVSFFSGKSTAFLTGSIPSRSRCRRDQGARARGSGRPRQQGAETTWSSSGSASSRRTRLPGSAGSNATTASWSTNSCRPGDFRQSANCTDFPHAALDSAPGSKKSVQNAVDQGRWSPPASSASLTPTTNWPGFGAIAFLKLMIAGLAHGIDHGSCAAIQGRARSQPSFPWRKVSAVVVEIGQPRRRDHAAKRIIGTTKTLTPEEAADPAFDLRALANDRRSAARRSSTFLWSATSNRRTRRTA